MKRKIINGMLLALIFLFTAGCNQGSVDVTIPVNPVAEDFTVSGLTAFFDGSPKRVTITANEGSSTGHISVWYEGLPPEDYTKTTAAPSATGSYAVTFDVAASPGFNAVNGLSAGTLVISAVLQDPVAEDYTIGGLNAYFDNSPKEVTLTPKAGSSTGTISIYYEGIAPTVYPRSTSAPSAIGSYAVTFDVAESPGFNAAVGLSAGTLVIISSGFNPVEPDTPWVEGNVTIDIFSFNDFHGTMDNSASASDPGADRFTAIAKHLMSQSSHSVILAAGDNYQGSALSNYFYGEPVSKMMKELGVRYSAIGNHEFDWGTEKIAKFAEDGDTVFLGANIFLKGTDEYPDLWHPYVIASRAGRRIGIIGLITTSTPILVSADVVEDYEFREPGPWLRNMVSDLRAVYQCDAVIALTHMGASGSGTNVSGEAARLANADMGFDAIISGHSHGVVNGTATDSGRNIPIVQAGFNGRNLSKLSLHFDEWGLVNISRDVLSGFTSGGILPIGTVDTAIADMVAEYEELIGPIMNEVIGVFGNAQTVGVNAWANQLVFDFILRSASQPDWAAGPGWEDFVLIQNAGGWRSVSLGGPNDPVTVRFMHTLMPFDNEIYLFELQGNYLINLLNGRPATGTGSLGSSPVITNASGSGNNWTVTSSGETINPAQMYKVSMNDFMFTGGDNYGVEDLAVYAPGTLVLGVPLRDGMIDQMKYRYP